MLSPFSYAYGLVALRDPAKGDNECKICYSCRAAFCVAAGGILASAVALGYLAWPWLLGSMWLSYETLYAIHRYNKLYEQDGKEKKLEDRGDIRLGGMAAGLFFLAAAQAVTVLLLTGIFPPHLDITVTASTLVLSTAAVIFEVTSNYNRIRDRQEDGSNGKNACWNIIARDFREGWEPVFNREAPRPC